MYQNNPPNSYFAPKCLKMTNLPVLKFQEILTTVTVLHVLNIMTHIVKKKNLASKLEVLKQLLRRSGNFFGKFVSFYESKLFSDIKCFQNIFLPMSETDFYLLDWGLTSL